MKTSQSFAFYPTDFLMGTVLFTAEQVGAYIRLLCYQWQEGSLPSDEKILAQYASTSPETISAIVGKFRTCSDGRLRNKKMEGVRKSLNVYKKSRSENAKKRWETKMHMHSTCIDGAEAMQCLPSPSPSPSPSPIPNNTPIAPKGAGGGWVPSETQKRLNRLFRRKDTTAWSAKERKAFKALGEIASEDLDRLERYYTARIPEGKDYRRRDLTTLLNNFHGEVDRARNFKETSLF